MLDLAESLSASALASLPTKLCSSCNMAAATAHVGPPVVALNRYHGLADSEWIARFAAKTKTRNTCPNSLVAKSIVISATAEASGYHTLRPMHSFQGFFPQQAFIARSNAECRLVVISLTPASSLHMFVYTALSARYCQVLPLYASFPGHLYALT